MVSRTVIVLLATSLVACAGQPQPGTETPNPSRDLESLRSYVLEHYTAPDSEIGGYTPEARFAQLGTAQVTELLPDRDFCHMYFSLLDGTYCYRHYYGEPFQLKRINPRAHPEAGVADALASAALGSEYPGLRDDLLLARLTRTGDLTCADFFVREIPLDADSVTYDRLWDAPGGVLRSGFPCRVGERFLPGELASGERLEDVELWDRFLLGGEDYLLILKRADECIWFELHRIRAAALESVTMVELGCL